MSSNLAAEGSLALELYRRLLPPVLYFFAPDVADGGLTGNSIEEHTLRTVRAPHSL